MVDITIVNGVDKPTYNWGAPSCRDIWDISISTIFWIFFRPGDRTFRSADSDWEIADLGGQAIEDMLKSLSGMGFSPEFLGTKGYRIC